MSELRDNVNDLFNHSITDSLNLMEWNNLLNFYTDNKNKLDDEEILLLYKKSEEYRECANKDREHFIEIKKASGRIHRVRTVKRGLNCKKSEVATDLYFIAEQITIRLEQEKQKKKENRKLPAILQQLNTQVPAYVSQ